MKSLLVCWMMCGLVIVARGQSSAAIKTSSVDTVKSYIGWTGKKVLGQHSGKVKLQSGSFRTKSGMLVAGEFVIDMTTIKNDDLSDPDLKKKLETHLKSDEFFNVANFPTATLKLTKILRLTKKAYSYNLTGDLTIKGITKSVSFPATFKPTGKGFEGNAKFEIDRSQWDVRYGSTNFFENLGDKAIKNEIELNVHVISH